MLTKNEQYTLNFGIQLPYSKELLVFTDWSEIAGIITMLRGNDTEHMVIKIITTCFIRSLMRPIWNYGLVFSILEIAEYISADRVRFEGNLRADCIGVPPHYLSHAIVACEQLMVISMNYEKDCAFFRSLRNILIEYVQNDYIINTNSIVSLFFSFKTNTRAKVMQTHLRGEKDV